MRAKGQTQGELIDMVHNLGFKCNRGVVRKNNEDSCFVIPTKNVYIVADGVGGNSSGEIASSTAVEVIADCVKNGNLLDCRTPEEIFGFLIEAIDAANSSIIRKSIDVMQNRGMATTVVLAYIYEGAAYIANVGDSRAYRFRNGTLKQITRDHTYVNELLESGEITPQEAENHAQKNVITRALGTERGVDPDFFKVALAPDDILLLCTDGLYGEVREDIMTELMNAQEDMNDLCAALVEEAIKAGGHDNITVICKKI